MGWVLVRELPVWVLLCGKSGLCGARARMDVPAAATAAAVASAARSAGVAAKRTERARVTSATAVAAVLRGRRAAGRLVARSATIRPQLVRHVPTVQRTTGTRCACPEGSLRCRLSLSGRALRHLPLWCAVLLRGRLFLRLKASSRYVQVGEPDVPANRQLQVG